MKSTVGLNRKWRITEEEKWLIGNVEVLKSGHLPTHLPTYLPTYLPTNEECMTRKHFLWGTWFAPQSGRTGGKFGKPLSCFGSGVSEGPGCQC